MLARLFNGPGSIRRFLFDALCVLAIFASPFTVLFLALYLES